MSDDIKIPGDSAYLSFGGWAHAMPNPPGLHERRRYVVDVECTAAGVKSSERGERGTRSLSILRVSEVAGVVVPPKRENEDEDDTPPMFNDDGTVADEASADEGDEIRAQRAEDKARAEAEAEADEDKDGEPWPGDDATGNDGSGNVSPLFKAADGE